MNDMSQNMSQTVQAMPRTVVLNDADRQPCEIWTRVMGYHRPVSSFNTGKKGEFYERKYFQEPQSTAAC